MKNPPGTTLERSALGGFYSVRGRAASAASSLRAERSNPSLRACGGRWIASSLSLPCANASRLSQAMTGREWREPLSRIHVHEIPQQRIDFVVPALAGEHAVM